MFQCSSCSGLQSARPLAKAPPFGRETPAVAGRPAAEGGAWDGWGWVEWAERDGSREAERDGSGERSCDGGGGGGDSCRGGSGGRAAGSGKDPKPSGSQCSSATWRVPPPSPLHPCSTMVSAATQLSATTPSKRACAPIPPPARAPTTVRVADLAPRSQENGLAKQRTLPGKPHPARGCTACGPCEETHRICQRREGRPDHTSRHVTHTSRGARLP